MTRSCRRALIRRRPSWTSTSRRRPITTLSAAEREQLNATKAAIHRQCAGCPLIVDCLYRAVVEVDVSGYVACTTESERALIRERLGIEVVRSTLTPYGAPRVGGGPVSHEAVLTSRQAYPKDTCQQLAERLGCSTSTIKRHLRREREQRAADASPDPTRSRSCPRSTRSSTPSTPWRRPRSPSPCGRRRALATPLAMKYGPMLARPESGGRSADQRRSVARTDRPGRPEPARVPLDESSAAHAGSAPSARSGGAAPRAGRVTATRPPRNRGPRMRAAATASWIARLMPTPPTGDIACAASPMQQQPGPVPAPQPVDPHRRAASRRPRPRASPTRSRSHGHSVGHARRGTPSSRRAPQLGVAALGDQRSAHCQ